MAFVNSGLLMFAGYIVQIHVKLIMHIYLSNHNETAHTHHIGTINKTETQQQGTRKFEILSSEYPTPSPLPLPRSAFMHKTHFCLLELMILSLLYNSVSYGCLTLEDGGSAMLTLNLESSENKTCLQHCLSSLCMPLTPNKAVPAMSGVSQGSLCCRRAWMRSS